VIGQTISHYRLLAELGRGGMGVVYKARDTHLDRFAAIKVLPQERVADSERQRRFVQEAKAASALNHPNIIHVYDIDRDSGVAFIAMEYVEGKTLHDIIETKGLKIAETLRYAAQVADALAAAHRAGIVHRDIKPSNIMVTEKGLVKVLDFGLAKLAEQASDYDHSNASTQTMPPQTEEGAVIGTAAYMSPEQAEGKKVDARSDIFSFGAVLYEMVTGQRAFQGVNKISVLSAVLHGEPAPINEISGEPVPSELQTLISRCLRKDPLRRIQHLDDVQLALEELKQEAASGRQTQPQIARTGPRRRWLWRAIPAALAASMLIGFLVWRAIRTPENSEPLRAASLTTAPGVHRYPSFSPEGNQVAFSWNGPNQDNTDVYVQQIGSSGSPLRLTTNPANDYNPVWSPDGRWIAFLRGESGSSELRLIPPLGGTERKLVDIHVRSEQVSPPFLTWCPDSTCLVVTDSPGEGKPDALFVYSLETGEKRQLTHPQPPALGDTHPAVSPDGNWLVFRHTVAFFGNELHKLKLSRNLVPAAEPQRLTPASLDGSYPTWTPDNKTILFSDMNGTSLWRLAADQKSPPARVPFVGEDGIMPVVSRPQPGRPARLAYARTFTDMRIWRIDTSGPGAPASSPPVICPVSSTRHDWMPQLSPDGRRVVFGSDRSGEGEIWAADLDGANAVQLTSLHGPPGTGYPHWSPDGKWIVFHSDKEVYIVSATGGKARNLTNHPALDDFPSFSRDGKWIYFSSNRAGEERIWKMPAAGGGPVPVTDFKSFAPIESADGAWLYYTDAVFTPGALWRIPVAGGAPAKLVDGVILVNYAVLPGGVYYIDRPAREKNPYFVDKPSTTARLRYFDFATHRAITIAGDLGNVDTPLTATRDGRTILFPRTTFSIDDLMLAESFR